MPKRKSLARPPRILIASDQNHGLRDLESFLSRHGYSVHRMYAGTPVLKRARSVRPDVVLLDAELADRQSLDLSRKLRDDPMVGASTPILLLVVGQPTHRDHVAALRAGIWELLLQPLNANDLLLKLDTYVLTKVEADRAPKDRVDTVTGLYTTAGLARRARELIFQASQHSTAVACVVFAPTLEVGAGATAELVPEVVRVLKTHGRRSDAIGRVGPTEFAVVAPGTDAAGAVKLAQRFRRSVQAEATRFALRAGCNAVGNVRDAPVEPKDLLARAARALQLAKAEGKWIRSWRQRP